MLLTISCGSNNILWFKLILADMYILQAQRIVPKFTFLEYPIPEIPGDSEKISGMDWVLPKNFGSGRVSGTCRALYMILLDTGY